MDNDGSKKPPDETRKKTVQEFVNENKAKIEALLSKKERKKRDTKFQPGNTVGVRFGYGQPTNLGGMKKANTTVLQEMKAAAETYGLAANEIARAMIKMAADDSIEARFRFPFMKEANLRIFGAPKASLEDTLKHINDKVDKLYELTMPLLEATAVGDGVALVRELMSQGKLDEVVRKIGEESGE